MYRLLILSEYSDNRVCISSFWFMKMGESWQLCLQLYLLKSSLWVISVIKPLSPDFWLTKSEFEIWLFQKIELIMTSEEYDGQYENEKHDSIEDEE